MSESTLYLVFVFFSTFTLSLQSPVFIDHSNAARVLRHRRANHFLEEIKPGNLERECYEETCSREEAAEIFQSNEKTMEFWYRYKSTSQCHKNVCYNGGICTKGGGQYECVCPPRYSGKHCETEVFECGYKNGGCFHYCSDSVPVGLSVTCGCADGYELDENGKSCRAAVPFSCGKQWIPDSSRRTLLDDTLNDTQTVDDLPDHPTNHTHFTTNHTHFTTNHTHSLDNATHPLDDPSFPDDSLNRIVGGQRQPQGGSPWQVLLRRKDERGFCGGTLVSERWVITAAHCLQETPDHVTLGDYDKFHLDKGELKIRVEKTIIHPHFHEFTFDSDVALLYLAEPAVLSSVVSPACLPNAHLANRLERAGEQGLVTGWGAVRYLGQSSRYLRKVSLPVVEQHGCIDSTDQVITDNMFCAGFPEAERDACTGDSGGPFVVNYRGTWFLTGVVSWGEECAAKGKYGIYTRISNFLSWIQEEMKKQEGAVRINTTHPYSR
ncbi:coagulation factor IX [Trichomycterus rosablanca]|uniref:coagulation factor IX n=1 Tax=Trichomycterus rosablanca TaxID=2290929 RepID=UPI002F35D92A